VVDATNVDVGFIRRIRKGAPSWSKMVRTEVAGRFGVNSNEKKSKELKELLDDWIRLDVIAKLTETDNHFVYYPFIVIILLGVSRLSYFDRWDLPLGLLIVILLGLGFSISCAIRLRSASEKVRKDVIERLQEKQMHLAGSRDDPEGLLKKIDLMLSYVKSIRSGAFVPFFEQPWVRATLIFITSGSGLTALQYLPWFQ
jgi:hypothetical protein